MNSPASSAHSRTRRSASRWLASPARPRPATMPVRTVGTTPVDSWKPTGHQDAPFTTRYVIQYSVPRKASDRLVTDVVTAALSEYGRIETPYLPRISSGMVHHAVASATVAAHQHSTRHRHHDLRAARR